ncbi:uncharacterized protein PG998_004829 [Apiospora kogelbergensis]|uniref:uncharacterized protein n=1 Tax=Apiospora kogelbergensis TaxID=1337665 RepID=UPI0031315274
MLVDNPKPEPDSNPTKAEFSELVTGQKWLASLGGVSSTTMKSAGVIVVLVAIVALGRASCLALTRPKPDVVCVVRCTDRIEQVIVSNPDIVLRRQESLLVDSFAKKRSKDDEIEDLARILRENSPANNATHFRSNHDQNHDVHLTGSQFGLDGLPNSKASTERSSHSFSSVTPPSESPDVGLHNFNLYDIQMLVERFASLEFEYALDSPRDGDCVSVASMVVVVGEDESQDFYESHIG